MLRVGGIVFPRKSLTISYAILKSALEMVMEITRHKMSRSYIYIGIYMHINTHIYTRQVIIKKDHKLKRKQGGNGRKK